MVYQMQEQSDLKVEIIMKPIAVSAIAVGIWLISPVPVAAQDARETLNACLSERIETEAQLLDCVSAAIEPCLSEPDDMNAVAALCFREARGQLDAGISAGMSDLRASASDEISTLVSIELKYDILSGLLQCDRMEELAVALSEYDAEAIQRQKAQCQATTSGLAYARLTLRGREN
jgi:hypothetical protein